MGLGGGGGCLRALSASPFDVLTFFLCIPLAIHDIEDVLTVEDLELHQHVGHEGDFVAICLDDFGRFFVGGIEQAAHFFTE